MMKTVMLIGALNLVVVGSAFAGVKEKKAMRETGEKASKLAEDMKKACGNKKLEVVVDWSAFEKYKDFADRSKPNALRVFGSVLADAGRQIVKLCSDADYKAEITKLTKVTFGSTPTFKAERKDVKYELSGTTLKIVLRPDISPDHFNQKQLSNVF